MWWSAAALAAELSGTLVGADGQPIVGATVHAYDSRFAYASAVTRSGGEWTIVGLPADRYRLRYLPANYDPHGDRFHGGAWDVCASEPVVLASEDDAVAGLDQALERGAAVVGRVLDLDGNPIPDVRVTVYGAEPRSSLVLRGDGTDADGTFSIVGLDAEPTGSAFYVVFSGDGLAEQWLGAVYHEDESERVSLAAATETPLGDVALLDGIRVSGRILGPDGPVASGTVYAYADQQVLGVTIAADGSYEADGLPPGDLVTWAQSPGLATTYYPDADRPSGSLPVPDEGADVVVDLTLPAESTLTLHGSGPGELAEVGVLLYNDSYSVGRGDGFDETDKAVFQGLWPGDYFLYVSGSAGGFESGFLLDESGERRRLRVDGHTVLDVELPAGATLSGTITDDEGLPVYGASVRVVETTGEQRTWSSSSARDGAWSVPGVAATTVSVGVSYAWYCPDDPGYAPTWHVDGRAEDQASTLLVAAGDAVEGLDVVLPRDDDHDGMGDAWEREHGLDPGRDDAGEDPDGDGYANGQEWVYDTDPVELAGDAECGGGSCAGGGLGLLPVAAVGVWRRRRGKPGPRA